MTYKSKVIISNKAQSDIAECVSFVKKFIKLTYFSKKPPLL